MKLKKDKVEPIIFERDFNELLCFSLDELSEGLKKKINKNNISNWPLNFRVVKMRGKYRYNPLRNKLVIRCHYQVTT
jgi:hypothetical protein